jgi:hypothetical protein
MCVVAKHSFSLAAIANLIVRIDADPDGRHWPPCGQMRSSCLCVYPKPRAAERDP